MERADPQGRVDAWSRTLKALTLASAVVDGEWEPLLDPVIDDARSTVRGTTLRPGRFGVVHARRRGRRCTPVQLRTFISAGAMSTSFAFRAPNTGTYTITASSTGLASDSQDETVR